MLDFIIIFYISKIIFLTKCRLQGPGTLHDSRKHCDFAILKLIAMSKKKKKKGYGPNEVFCVLDYMLLIIVRIVRETEKLIVLHLSR